MKKKVALTVFAALLFVSLPGFSWGWGRHVVFFGPQWWPGPWWYPYAYYPPSVYYYPPPVYYYPPPAIVESPPPLYAPPQAQYWYWCSNPQGYYPYIQDCPSGWRPVSPQ